LSINGQLITSEIYNINISPLIKFSFSSSIDHASVANSFSFTNNAGSAVTFNTTYTNGDSVVIIRPAASLDYLARYAVSVSTTLKSKEGGSLKAAATLNFVTQIDSSDKFTRISNDALLDLVQKQTFKYFWDFGHPVSGMARERNSSGDVVTTGGTGFGVMSIIAAVDRNFISRADGLQRITITVHFLKNHCTRYHGAV
jgi:hypothetical protein